MMFLLTFACTPPTEVPTGTDTDTDVVDTAPPTPTGDTGPDIPVVDCTIVPGPPFDSVVFDTPRGYHGVTFDETGQMVGSDGNSLVVSTSGTDSSLLAPNVGYTEQMEFLEGGDIAVARNGAIWRMGAGGSTQLASGINAYGLTIGPDGMIYTANNSDIHRIDPDTGDTIVWMDFPPGNSPKVLDFSVDHTKMYVGTLGTSGDVYEIQLTADFMPDGLPTYFSSTDGSWHDGLRVDACGRVYVAEYNTTSLYMISPEGDSTRLVDYPFDMYGHGINWGRGVGEWDDHTIYVPQPYNSNTVAQVFLGVPSADYNGGIFEVLTE